MCTQELRLDLSHELIAGMALNEKVAGLLLPDLRGSLDFSLSFVSGVRISLVMFGMGQKRQ